MRKAELESAVRRLEKEHGEWIYDVLLPHGVWTKGNSFPHTRLRRLVQIVADTVCKPLSECRILDLGCLEGQFALEFAKQGAASVGIEIRSANLSKASFLKDAWGLKNLDFYKDDVRNLRRYGDFDAVLCSGILYHLPAADAVDVVRGMYEISRVAVIDTHVALVPEISVGEYRGRLHIEHEPGASKEQKEKARLASADNETSFWFTRPSLVNLLTEMGFSSVYECFVPSHLNYGRPGIESMNRCTFVAIRGDHIKLITSPGANELRERWPEGSLSYAEVKMQPGMVRRVAKRLLGRR